MHNNYMCLTNLPKINDLLCLFATIHTPEKVNTSYYNVIIKKCRQLIFENSDVLASPNLDKVYGINIIVKENFYETGQIQKYLSNHNLKTGAPTSVTKYIYEDCCMYTIIAKLAPKWNIVSNYFIRGRDFLTNTILKDCVRLSVCINDKGETSMIFEISRIKLPSMSLDKLDLPDRCIRDLKENNIIVFKYCDSKSIRVLPSLKQGKILAIHHNINKSASLENYQQFRRHWKNTYGYRLPEIENDIFYLDISFFDGSPVFTYPSICVRPYEPTFIQRVEPGPIVAGFIADLMRSMPNILGDKYPVPSHIIQPKPFLFPSTKNLQYSNICPIDLKTIPDSQNSAIVYLPTQKQTNIENDGQDSKTKLSQLLSQLNKTEHRPIYLSQKAPFTQKISQASQIELQEKFDKNEIVGENIKTSEINKTTIKPSLISQEIQNQAQFLLEKLAERSNMTPKKITNLSNQQITSDKKTTEKYAPVFISKFPKIKTIKNLPASVIKPVQKEIKSQEIIEDNLNDFQTSDKKINKKQITQMFNMNNSNKAVSNKIKEKENKKTFEKNNNTERKRVLSDNNSESTITKKPREKPIVTEVKDMKELVNNGKINKLNIQSLMKWLKERNIPCTTKDKKSILIEKVISNISKK